MEAIGAVERVSNSPTSTWQATGGPDAGKQTVGGPDPNAATHTRSSRKPVRYAVRNNDHGRLIEVIVEPAGEGIITGYDQGTGKHKTSGCEK